MILDSSYKKEHIDSLRNNMQTDPSLIERSIFALSLLEELQKTGLDFIFKGGSSLMLLLEEPRRLSTDIDIICDPDVDIDEALVKITTKKFFKWEEQNREDRGNLKKRHFKFYYYSVIYNRELYILLDVIFCKNNYTNVISKEINSELLICDDKPETINLPSVDCLLADKLTAFAPHTTGIVFGIDKELEIIKQLYDISCLIDVSDDIKVTRETFNNVLKSENNFRNSDYNADDVLDDVIDSCICIAARGKYKEKEYLLFLNGIRKIKNHIYGGKFSSVTVVEDACKIMYYANCLKYNVDFTPYHTDENLSKIKITDEKLQNLVYIKKINEKAYYYVCKTSLILES